jgi:apolipoprotein N-acyltransferase
MEHPLWEKISAYFSAARLTGGLFTALAGSAFLYLDHRGLSALWLETPLALLFLLLLLSGDQIRWFWSGLFLGLFWFGWIGLSFLHYGHPRAVPFVSLAVALIYALIFWLMAFTAERVGEKLSSLFALHSSLFTSAAKAVWLWLWSFIHPLGFDWFKPELTLVHTFFGVDGMRFALILSALLLLLWGVRLSPSAGKYRHLLILPAAAFLLGAVDLKQSRVLSSDPAGRIELAGTRIPVEEKWLRSAQREAVRMVLAKIDRAVASGKRAVFLPESVLPIFLNHSPAILKALQERSKKIDIVLGALYLTPDRRNRNSAYRFHEGNYTVADKVVLVPFGEANPLPSWAGRWINRIFFDGAPDYKAAAKPTDFLIDGKKYRAAVCFEGTSERLYADRPKRMVLLSNNGWFVPSVEPTLQKLLLEYYHRKYGTEIWHAVNMSESYVVTGKRERGE